MIVARDYGLCSKILELFFCFILKNCVIIMYSDYSINFLIVLLLFQLKISEVVMIVVPIIKLYVMK